MSEEEEIKKEEDILYGLVKIDLNRKRVYVQWSEDPNPDWSKGEDLIYDLVEDSYYVWKTFYTACIIDVDITPDAIIFYLKATI
jgi:hypothetical protein